ncbi:MAG: methyl-accepting chemotaxis protein [Steroidobacteraceae bacterium]
MRLKTRFGFSALLVSTLALLLLGLVAALWSGQRAQSEADARALVSLRLSQELRQSSDELTRLARTYVVTADPGYEAAYWQVLAVRDGRAERPDGRRAPLRQLMEEAGFTQSELALLQQAEDNSNQLVAIEVAAFQAMQGRFVRSGQPFSREAADYAPGGAVDQGLAVRIMHDATYHAEKARIMQPIDEAVAQVAARTREEVELRAAANRRVLIAALLVGAVLVLVVWLNHQLAQRPVILAIAGVTRDLDELARGTADLSRRIKSGRDDEIGELSNALDRTLDRVQSLLGEVALASGAVTQGAVQLGRSAADLQSQVQGQVTAISEVAAAARAISEGAGGLSTEGGNMAASVQATAAHASAGEQALVDLVTGMEDIETASQAMTARLTSISERARDISGVVEAIARVASQTNLLSLNAEIEAEKAGEAGQGFSVVAREVRRLADQSARSAADVERNVAEMRNSVEGGVVTLDGLAQKVTALAAVVQDVYRVMGTITGDIRDLAPRFEHLDGGARSQAAAAAQIAAAVKELEASAMRAVAALTSEREVVGSLEQAAVALRTELAQVSGS